MLIRLADRKEVLRGDLHLLQDRALLWLMDQEFSSEARLERERMKYTLLAGNPQLYDSLYKEEDDEVPNDEDIEWQTPESVEEVEDILQILGNIQSETGV